MSVTQWSDNMSQLSRRDFLKLLRNGFLYVSGSLALGGLLRFLDYDPNPEPKTEFVLGAASKYPLHSRTVLSDPPAVLVHDEKGFSAFSLVCTHLGCTLQQDGQSFACACHGSRYNTDGTLAQGPADKPLLSLRVEVTEEGNLILFTV
jgi:Rieske Fe-S protein